MKLFQFSFLNRWPIPSKIYEIIDNRYNIRCFFKQMFQRYILDILYTNSRQETIERKQQSETALHRRGGYIHATHTREARNRERNYLDASLAYPVRLGVLLRVPAEFEDCDEDGQSQAANQHDKDTAWNGKNRKLIILPPPAVSAPSPFLLPRMLHG